LDGTGAHICGSAPGLPCGSPLREAEWMPHPDQLAKPQPFRQLAIPEVCPPGEGTVVEIDKIFWETKQAS
jgi:hypothetical protein